MPNKDWIKNLKPGDQVTINGKYVKLVERVTPSGRIVVGGATYNSDGSMRGGSSWNHSWLVEATPDIIERITSKETIDRARQLARQVCEGKIDVDLQQAQSLIDLISGWNEEAA